MNVTITRLPLPRALAALIAPAALALLPAAASAQLDAGDVGLTVESGRIVTNLIPEDGGDASPRRVFVGELGVFEDEGDGAIFPPPVAGGVPTTNTPGFDSEAGTFAVGQSVGLDVLSNALLDRPVVRYDPAADALAATGVDVQVSFTNSNITRTNGETTATGSAGVLFLPVFSGGGGEQDAGRFHRHYNFALFDGIDGGTGALLAPADGVYVLEADLDYTGTDIASSDPFLFVFGVNAPDADVREAVDFLNANVVPEPTGLAAVAVGAVALLRRRRASR